MKMDKPGNYQVRLVGSYVKFYKHWKPISAITHPDIKKQDPVWVAGFYPNKRYAINVIDRADGKLKVLEKGSTVFKNFHNYRIANPDIDPAGPNGPDFVITVDIPGGQKLNTTYGVGAKGKPSPFTAEEKAMIKENFWPINEVYKSTPLDKIQSMWDALDPSEQIPPKRDSDGRAISQQTKAPTTANVASVEGTLTEELVGAAASETDDLFPDDDDSADTF